MTRGRAAAMRLVGAGVAVGISAAIASVASVVWGLHFLWAGAPVVLVLGGWLGPRAVTAPMSAVGSLAVGSVLLGDAVLVVATALDATGPIDPAEYLLFGLIGLVYLGLPMLLLTSLAAVVWLWAVRWVARAAGYPLG